MFPSNTGGPLFLYEHILNYNCQLGMKILHTSFIDWLFVQSPANQFPPSILLQMGTNQFPPSSVIQMLTIYHLIAEQIYQYNCLCHH